MGILNLTEDSFSGDGLARSSLDAVLAQARRMVEEGADILDVGAESTRPGAEPVSLHCELTRILPVLDALHGLNLPLSVDTCKPEVMAAALAAGADMINDVMAFRAPGALAAVAHSQAALCVMHMQGEPRTMQQAPAYGDVVAEVHGFLAERLAILSQGGVAPARLVVDPGFGFGKSLAHNYTLLACLEAFRDLGVPLLAGMSRKSMLGAVTGRPAHERVSASVAAAVLAAERGAAILRVHDVAATCDGLKVWQAMRSVRSEG